RASLPPEPAAAAPAPAARSRRDWSRWAMPLAASLALAIGLNTMLATRRSQGVLADELVAGHVRSLQAEHLADVASTDQHTVKPWFAGRLDYAPPVRDLAAQDFPLTGGRLDYVEHRQVAALVYRHRKHIINLYVWPGGGGSIPEVRSQDGYSLVHWSQGGMEWWAVSDLNAVELKQFAELQIAAGT
ncbi:MAG: hypothetical protein P4L83_12410, partial [Nevskia sp.]|nr:hypothetical protein [Nevskia sp.]